MNITIAHRLRPFSHRAGSIFLLPNSHFKVEIFPALIRCIDLENRIDPIEIYLFIKGPVQSFTAELDLERGYISVFGVTQDGYVRYRLFYQEEQILLMCEKVSSFLQLQCRAEALQLKPKQVLAIPIPFCLTKPLGLQERLHLGIHKSQDWELIKRRCNLQEIFPFWLALAQWIPPITYQKADRGMFTLLNTCQELIEKKDKLQVIDCFTKIFLAAFEGVFVPRLFDRDYQGIMNCLKATTHPVLALLLESAKLLRTLFFREENSKLLILPCLPPKLHCGRITQLQTEKLDCLDVEWSKKRLRQMFIQMKIPRLLTLQLPKEISRCRLRVHRKDKGKTLQVTKDGILTIPVLSHGKAWLDCFEK